MWWRAFRTRSFSLDSRWRVTYANASALRLFDRNLQDMLGLSLWDLMPSVATREAHYEALLTRHAAPRDGEP
jgi:PAS domain-containing protein